VSGIERVLMMIWKPLSYRVFGLSISNGESRRADSNRLTLLQLRVITEVLQGFARACKSAFLSHFLCSGLLRVAPHCVPGGVNKTSMLRFTGSLINSPPENVARGVATDTPSGVFTVQLLCFHYLFLNLQANR
jgi:hypothetical protein